MAKEFFRDVRFRPESIERIRLCNKVIARYQAMNLRLTLRQLYYQLVTINAIPNEEKSYKHLSSLVSDARIAGLMDWDAIEDRVRRPRVPQEFENLGELVDVALGAYKLPRWRKQEHYVELWVEKDALAGVLQPIAQRHHVTLMVNRGYSSQSAMYEAANRLSSKLDGGDAQFATILYLGDHDPSGEDMVRDIQERLTLFGADVEVRKVALTIDQVRKFKPPPNPAKITDPRAEKYIAKFGRQSWEVDALPPDVLTTLLNAEIAAFIDDEQLEAVIEQEKSDRDALRQALSTIRGDA